MQSKVRLKAGKERALLRGHPWVFSGAIAGVDGTPEAGATLDIVTSTGQCVAQAAFSPMSQIRARVWTFDPKRPVDAEFFRARIAASVQRRSAQGDPLGATRLVHGEADGLPGLIVDRYADVLVVQLSTQGVEYHRSSIIAALLEVTQITRIYERSDADVRQLEGLSPAVGVLAGGPFSTAVPILEHGLWYEVDIAHGQKTGFYIDQRESRRQVAAHAFGEVLNCFCYTGGFTLAALHAGAVAVTSIDSSADALALARTNLARNGLPEARASWICGDVFAELRSLRDSRRQFDVIILDPPKFAPTAAHLEKAARAYKDINLLGLKLLRPGGLLFTFSCSGGVSADLFQKILAGAASDAQARVRVVAHLAAPDDHPVLLSFPEGDYLKGLLLQKLGDD